MGFVPLERRPHRAPSPPPPCEGAEKRAVCNQTPNRPAPGPWTSGLQNREKYMHAICMSPVIFCYSCLNEERQVPSEMLNRIALQSPFGRVRGCIHRLWGLGLRHLRGHDSAHHRAGEGGTSRFFPQGPPHPSHPLSTLKARLSSGFQLGSAIKGSGNSEDTQH